MIGTILGGGPLAQVGMLPHAVVLPVNYAMLVDWSNSGTFSSAYSNVSSDLLYSVSCARGRDVPHPLLGRSPPGTLTFTLNNSSQKYSSLNATSPLFGSVEVGRLVQWRTVYGIRWTGYITSILPAMQGGLAVVKVTAQGVLSRLAGKRISPAADAGSATGTVIGEVLTAAGFAGTRHLDAGQATTSRWFVQDKDALEALREIEDTELGWIKEDADGAISFEDRSHRLQGAFLVTGGLYSDNPWPSPISGSSLGANNPYTYIDIQQQDPIQYLINDVTATVTPYTVSGLAVLWTFTDSAPTLNHGASITLIATYPNPAAPSGAYVDAWTTPVVGTDITQAGVANGDIGVSVVKVANLMYITVTNNHATNPCSLTLVQARGTAVVKGTPTSVNAQDTASQAKYGIRSYRLPAPWLQNTNVAITYVALIISSYKGQRPSLQVKFLASMSAALFTQLVSQDNLSSRRTIVAAQARTGLQMSQDFFIERITDVYDIERNRYEITYELSQVGPETAVGATNWILGTNVLDSTTYLA